MRKSWLAGAIAASAMGCTTYTGVARQGDTTYITGSFGFALFTVPWLRKCIDKDGRLVCKEIAVDDAILKRRGRPAEPPPPEDI